MVNWPKRTLQRKRGGKGIYVSLQNSVKPGLRVNVLVNRNLWAYNKRPTISILQRNWIIIHVLINWPLIFVKCRGRRSAIQSSQESKYIRTGDQKHVFWRGSSKICHLNVKNKYCNDKKALAAIFSPCIVILGSQLRRFFFLFDYSNFFSSGSILEYIKRRFRSLYKSNKLVIGLMKYKWTPSNTIPQFII